MKKSDIMERKIYECIADSIASHGYPPSVREICKAVNLKSTSSVHGYLVKMEKAGIIKRNPLLTRAIMLNKSPYSEDSDENIITTPEVAEVPVVGKVAAGVPILAKENIESIFPVPMSFIDSGEHFMLKVKGDSMINVGIFNNDYVLVKKQQDADNGKIVVAMIDDGATVKTFYKTDGYVILYPENNSMEPIKTTEATILGVVTGVFRQLK